MYRIEPVNHFEESLVDSVSKSYVPVAVMFNSLSVSYQQEVGLNDELCRKIRRLHVRRSLFENGSKLTRRESD